MNSTIESNTSQNSAKKIELFGILAAIVAIGIHSYLLKTHYDLKFGEIEGKLSCDISSYLSCSAASASPYSEAFGIPMALWGILVNLGYLGLLLAAAIFQDQAEKYRKLKTSAFALAGILVLASVTMGLISSLKLSSICPFCALTYLLSGLTLWGATRSATQDKDWFTNLKSAVVSPDTAGLILGAALLVGGFIGNDVAQSSYQGASHVQMAQAIATEWVTNPPLNIENKDPLTLGAQPEKSRLRIIEFADFRCIHCKHAAPSLKAFVMGHNDVSLEFYSWPLDGECNSSIHQNNGASCLLARLVWCARKQNAGWPMHEKIFERFDEWRTREAVSSQIGDLALAVGIDANSLKTCSDSEEAMAAIKSQADLGTGLNISGTPALYANGKALPPGAAQIPVLEAIYRATSK